MKRKKINLDGIKVKSFITTIDSKIYKTIKGKSVFDHETIESDEGTLDPLTPVGGITDHGTCETKTETAGTECMNLGSMPPCNIG